MLSDPAADCHVICNLHHSPPYLLRQVFDHGQPSSQCSAVSSSNLNTNLIFANNSHEQSHVDGWAPAAALFMSSEGVLVEGNVLATDGPLSPCMFTPACCAHVTHSSNCEWLFAISCTHASATRVTLCIFHTKNQLISRAFLLQLITAAPDAAKRCNATTLAREDSAHFKVLIRSNTTIAHKDLLNCSCFFASVSQQLFFSKLPHMRWPQLPRETLKAQL